MRRFDNKIGLVTAAGSGMGRAGAIRFASEGASVVVVDIDAAAAEATVETIRAAGGTATAVQADLSGEVSARRIVADAVTAYGGLDFVWNHCGDAGSAKFEEMTEAEFDSALDINVRNATFTTVAAVPELRKRGGGAVLFTASISGLSASPFSPLYGIAKFGVIGLMRSLAKRYARENMRFNAVCPGPINTPMLRVFVNRPDMANRQNRDPEEIIRDFVERSPMGRMAEPSEVAAAAAFLLSSDASFVNGVALPVDGGILA